jgi:glycosyltransferase involved in cell wall biosynthesis
VRILHINTERTWRGGEQQTLYLLEGLKRRNIDSVLICQPNSPMAERARAAGIEVFPVAMHGEVDLPACLRMRRLIKRFNTTIIHSHTSHAHALAFWASLGTNVGLLVTRRVDFSIFRHSFLKLSGIKYSRMADYYIAISHKIKDVLVADGLAGERIFVVHSGIDIERFAKDSGEQLTSEFNLKPDAAVVINVAHLAGHKGQKYLVRAIPHVLEKIPHTRFFIVGDGELRGELEELAGLLNLKESLTFTGFRKDVGAFYKIADLFVMSSIQEGLGTAVLDALATCTPVVAAKSGGIPEIIQDGETGRLVNAADPAALAAGIIELLTHPQRAQQMAQNGHTAVLRDFSIDTMVEKNIQIYQKVIGMNK